MKKNKASNITTFIAGRLANFNNTAEGATLPPRQQLGQRVPFVTNLQIIKRELVLGQPVITLAWEAPPDPLRTISHYNIYIIGILGNNEQPIGPTSVARSPAVIAATTDRNTNVTFRVQTVLNSGLSSAIDLSPSVSCSVTAPVVSTADLPLTGVASGTYGSATQVGQFTVDGTGRLTAAVNVTISGASPGGSAGGGLAGTYPNPTIRNMATEGAVAFVSSTTGILTQDATQFFWDATNNRLGIGTDTPTEPLHVVGNALVTGDLDVDDIDADDVNLNDLTINGGIGIEDGTNDSLGVSTLVAGTVVVANTRVTANSRIFLTGQTTGTADGELTISARTPGTDFTILSTEAADDRDIAWLLIEPV